VGQAGIEVTARRSDSAIRIELRLAQIIKSNQQKPSKARGDASRPEISKYHQKKWRVVLEIQWRIAALQVANR